MLMVAVERMCFSLFLAPFYFAYSVKIVAFMAAQISQRDEIGSAVTDSSRREETPDIL